MKALFWIVYWLAVFLITPFTGGIGTVLLVMVGINYMCDPKPFD